MYALKKKKNMGPRLLFYKHWRIFILCKKILICGPIPSFISALVGGSCTLEDHFEAFTSFFLDDILHKTVPKSCECCGCAPLYSA